MPFAGWTLDEAAERIVGTAADEASCAALTSAVASGHLVPYLPSKSGGLPERLGNEACNDIVQVHFREGAKAARKNRDVVLFPTVCAPDAPDFLHDLSLAQAMSTYVLKDPEFLRWAPLAIAADDVVDDARSRHRMCQRGDR
ncbi:hypothetical protein OAM26_05015 [Porticoccaceae bacterium]|nr:hypothetical protein [Porticoccaceae bacterium]